MYRHGCGAWLRARLQNAQSWFRGSAFPVAALTITTFAAFFAVGVQTAHAVPSFARQTGQPCGTCHTDFPGLTPFGRLFKLNGYTTGGGPFRTTPFPSWGNPDKALADYAKKTNDQNTTLSGKPDTSDIWVPPLALMEVYGYTHTKIDYLNAPYHANDNANNVQLSFFYGGAITDHIGLFSQVTYGGPPVGGSVPDDTGSVPLNPAQCANCEWGWDNADLRYANTGKLGDMDVIYGITANNNPTVQDPWNTVPAWGFPYMVSNISDSCCSPAASTFLDGGTYGMHVGGAGAYAFINNLVYLELTAYRTLDFKTLPKLGQNSFDMPGPFSGVAPYWRVALEPHWGRNWFEFGAFGMSARVHPWTQVTDSNGYLIDQSFSETERYTDVAFDTQYQYQGDNYWLTLRGTYIHESQNYAASFGHSADLANVGATAPANPTDTLNSLKAYASLAYGNDNRIVLSGQYFDTWGTSDSGLYGSDLNPDGSPNSDGFVAEIAYIPFISSTAPIWPWANMRVGLQYTYYNKFNGTTENAHDNNSLFAYLWFAM